MTSTQDHEYLPQVQEREGSSVQTEPRQRDITLNRESRTRCNAHVQASCVGTSICKVSFSGYMASALEWKRPPSVKDGILCAGDGAVATVLGVVLVENCLHRWFEHRLVLADDGELRQEKCGSMFGSESRPAREKSCSAFASCGMRLAHCLKTM